MININEIKIVVLTKALDRKATEIMAWAIVEETGEVITTKAKITASIDLHREIEKIVEQVKDEVMRTHDGLLV
ncbi:hypothetical protein [Calidifontibacillus erzurumensis]|uniref:Uncharacterized protein n=1 Tax=Calidifontibacillus erzurumensis TaxID=2741433 RepID=A0A8J8GD88_9BACI|nr:hypothetical protein [Calidifontibacillus erzurumensis]NSL51709.1 hypothetical protein [Calidifontibacillus erzurumensis]